MPEFSQKPNPSLTKWKVLSLSMELGFIIALPLVALGLAGKWLDGKLGTTPWFTLAAIILAITATTVWLIKRFKELLK
ncbi:MAG: AtpZ/AtpI family protein [Candidatus Doudnabacteria bacterium]|nr:AtpZ/AtpI family protein [Candidatus Doudnabacteria bacterium]